MLHTVEYTLNYMAHVESDESAVLTGAMSTALRML